MYETKLSSSEKVDFSNPRYKSIPRRYLSSSSQQTFYNIQQHYTKIAINYQKNWVSKSLIDRKLSKATRSLSIDQMPFESFWNYSS